MLGLGLGLGLGQQGQRRPLAVPQLGSCASSGRAWRLWAARHSQGEAGPLGAQPLPRVLALAASTVTDSTAFDAQQPSCPLGVFLPNCLSVCLSACPTR